MEILVGIVVIILLLLISYSMALNNSINKLNKKYKDIDIYIKYLEKYINIKDCDNFEKLQKFIIEESKGY